MKHLGAGVKVGLLVLLVAILGYSMFKAVNERASGDGGYTLWARFRDASGLVDKSRVVIAGLTVGEIVSRKLDGRFARVTVRVRKDTQIWSNAAILKKSSSLLGEFYLEIDPGTPQSTAEDGRLVANVLLKDGDEIKKVIESTTPSDIMAQAGRILPHVDEVLIQVRDLAADTRALINGPVAKMANTLDKAIEQDAELVTSILQRADKITADIHAVTATSGDDVQRIVANVDQSVRDLRELIAITKGEVQSTGEGVRAGLAKLERSLEALEGVTTHSASVVEKIDNNEGTLGRLVNDTTVYDNIEKITQDARGFTSSLFGLQTVVGLRSEYNLFAQAGRSYFSIELYTRPDKYYLVELVSDPRGEVETDLVFDEASGALVRQQSIEHPGLRLSVMYARKGILWDPLTLRVGLKESSGGVGADVDLWGGARISVDLFDFQFDELPRLRLTAAWHFYKYLYVLGGVDDVLNPGGDVVIAGDDITGDMKTTYHYGRDFFFGGMLRFTDEDLRTLLFVGGSALANLAE